VQTLVINLIVINALFNLFILNIKLVISNAALALRLLANIVKMWRWSAACIDLSIRSDNLPFTLAKNTYVRKSVGMSAAKDSMKN